MDASGDLFGTTVDGGASHDGDVYEIVKSGSTYSSTPIVVASFNSTDGSFPEANLIMDASGDLFGTTSNGGTFASGAAFEIVKSGSTYSSTPTVLASFNGGASGRVPNDGLIMDSAGDLFGTTQLGGTSSDGVVFEIVKSGSTYSGAPTVLSSFSGSNGDVVFGNLVMDAAGDLFGATQQGGASNDGEVSKSSRAAAATSARRRYWYHSTAPMVLIRTVV